MKYLEQLKSPKKKFIKQYVAIHYLDKISELVMNYYGITHDQLKSNSRRMEYVSARRMYFLLSLENTDINLEPLGETMGKNHSTVLSHVRKLRDYLELGYPTEKKDYTILTKRIKEELGL